MRCKKGVKYREILIDVCNHLAVQYNKDDDVDLIEMNLLLKIVSGSLDKLDQDSLTVLVNDLELEQNVTKESIIDAIRTNINTSKHRYYNVAFLVANSLAKALLGRNLPQIANKKDMWRSIFMNSGSISWIVTGILTAIDIAGPAYRVTVPCVIHIAYLRRKLVKAQDNR